MQFITHDNKFIEPKFEIKKEEKKIEYEFQQLGVDMGAHFGKAYKKKIWPLFHKKQYTLPMIRDSWIAYQKSTIKSFRYFMGILNNKARIKKK